MKIPEYIKQDIIDCMDEAIVVNETGDAHDLLDFADKAHVCMSTALTYIQQLESSYSQVSKALCGKENATLDEVLQAVSQVKNPVVDGIDGGKMQLDAYLRSIKSKLKYAEAERDVRSKLAIEQAQRIADLLQCRESYIFDLETELEAVKRERDAAVIALHGNCEVCRHEESLKCASCIFNEDAWNNPDDNWQWCVVCPENTEVQDDD